MTIFAEIKDGLVVNIMVADQEFINTLPNPQEWLEGCVNCYGNVHYDSNNLSTNETALRANHPGIGYVYDAENDVFYLPKPIKNPSFVLNTKTWLWEPPIAAPEDNWVGDPPKVYYWDEISLSWLVSPNTFIQNKNTGEWIMYPPDSEEALAIANANQALS